MNKYLYYKDKKLRNNIFKKRKKIFLYKSLLLNKKIKKSYRFKIMHKLQMYQKNFFFTKKKNRCIMNNKTRSILRITQTSKYYWKNFASNGLINGFKKSSW